MKGSRDNPAIFEKRIAELEAEVRRLRKNEGLRTDAVERNQTVAAFPESEEPFRTLFEKNPLYYLITETVFGVWIKIKNMCGPT